MTHYRHQPVIVVPKAKRDAFEAILKRHGFGGAFVWREVIGKASSSNAPATHYAVECIGDNHLAAVLKLAAKAVAGSAVTEGKRGESKAASVLDKAGLKVKPEAAGQVVR